MERQDFIQEYVEYLKGKEYDTMHGIEEEKDVYEELEDLYDTINRLERNYYLNSRHIVKAVDELKEMNNPELDGVINFLTRLSWDVSKGLYRDEISREKLLIDVKREGSSR